MSSHITPAAKLLPLDRSDFEVTMKRRFFFAPGFALYGGERGLFDYGPPGTAIKSNLLHQWRQHFIIEEDMLETSCPAVTPEKVFIASGHVAKFTDKMVRNEVSGECYRADHLLEEKMDELLKNEKLSEIERAKLLAVRANADNYSLAQLADLFKEYAIVDPNPPNKTDVALSAPYFFNLMFQTSIGPRAGGNKGYLRPELAQGIFLNFPRLLEYNNGRLPFAGCQIGAAYRNEINPRAGLLRVREFELAEIEHFVDPIDKRHPKFASVADVMMRLQPRGEMTERAEIITLSCGDAVRRGLIAHETLAYFMARTQLYLISCGAKPHCVRFRQHGSNEMAHYANDCWDAELLTTYGWIECVGHADRGNYDLTVHSEATKSSKQMLFWRDYDEPREVEELIIKVDKKTLGPKYGKDARTLIPYLEGLSNAEALKIQRDFEAHNLSSVTVDGQEFPLTPDLLQFTRQVVRKVGEHVMPHVIEPSFGVGRILYSILEQCFWIRDPENASQRITPEKLARIKEQREGAELMRNVLSLPPQVAPVKACVIPLIAGSAEMLAYIPQVVSALKRQGLSSRVDSSKQAIGRRYARNDEIGVPYGITIDTDTLVDGTVTLRDRDSTLQLRVPSSEIAQVLRDLCDGFSSWSDVAENYPSFGGVDEEME